MHKRQKKKIKIKFTELFCVHLDFYCVMRRRKEREKKKKKDRIKHWMNKRKGLKKDGRSETYDKERRATAAAENNFHGMCFTISLIFVLM